MKTPAGLLCIGMILAFVVMLSGCGPKHYTPRENEEIYGIWVSAKSNPQKLVMMANGTWEEYIYQSDTSPSYKGIYEIIEKWKDSAGNTWYKEIVTSTYGIGKGGKSQELDKIDKSGSVWELVYTEVGKYDPKNFPTEIDTKNNSYRIYERSTR